MIRSTPSPARTACSILATSSGVAPSPSSRLLVSMARMIAMATSRMPIAAVPMPSQTPSPVIRVSDDADQREDQAEQRAGVLEQHDRQLRGLGPADEVAPRRSCRGSWFDSWIAVRNEKLSSTIATTSTAIGTHLPLGDRLRVRDLVVGLVEREQATDAEQHDRHDERVDVAVPAVAEGVFRGGLALRPLAAEQQQRLVARVGDRVDRLGQHRRGAGQDPGDELGDRDAQVRQQGRDDRPGAASGTHWIPSGIGLLSSFISLMAGTAIGSSPCASAR